MSPADLARLLGLLPTVHDKNVLLGEQAVDDAGVYLIAPGLALVQTVDFFPPVVDDPYMYGRIAAANSLSDVWAMGGRAVTAMNIVGFPDDVLDVEILAQILKGGADAAREAQVSIIGGHTMRDKEIKYGMAVTGTIDPDRIVTNAGARPGNRLVLTKPIGSGVITTALRVKAVPDGVMDIVTKSMAAFNMHAAEAMVRLGASAATDITGYGLVGHSLEMARGSKLTFVFDTGQIPLHPSAVDLAKEGYLPAGSYANKNFFSKHVGMDEYIPEELGDLFFDAQTSGGLLIALAPEAADALVVELHGLGVSDAAVVGDVQEFDGKSLRFVI